ncbi:DNA methyltransferase [Azovibrio restrictus]|uniref:Eco57I restriction-modification methylase domain-containing protein n=1 Tax=Azovibrio restrictus TaxID=146938 RepID=UPI0026F3294F|nr:DNA methyltransferase [Azovibrio restrictus]
MARKNANELAFPALSIEGGLLAPDFLNKVAHLDASEQTEADYDIPRGLKLRDEIGRYWKIAQTLWQDFAAKRARTDLNTHALTIKELLEPLLRHVFCFGDLKAVGQVTLGERVFPIGFAANEGRVPVVLAAHDQLLDKPDARFGDGVRRRSPFLLAQEYLNASDGALWAIVGNGLKLRILRDNPSLTRPAYIEADLEAIFNEGLYPDFTALWLLAHASRFGKVGTEPANCPLERWRNTAQEDGIRARDRLRIGVTEALRALGTGFLTHPANTELRRRLETGELSTQAYFEQLLRLIYRFIFLATIEDRELVFAPEAEAKAKARYLAGYSLTRLRQLAARRRSYDRHADLWQALTITFTGLGKGQPALGLPALGGLFAASHCPDLDTAQLDNSSLLSALFSLCFFRDGAALSRVNYRDMDSEELGSVYESLLELVPNLTLTAGVRRFGFIGDEEEGSTKGNARKLTGSYYTPDSLVQELIKSALEPVIARTLAENPQEPVKALLALTVCDPACGSGHFLLAAARRIADEVALLRAPEGNPTQQDFRHALRDVVAHCIYGVDKNPMAVELARTALWLEAYTPERPLTFLDAHLRCGDALLGILDPTVLDAGIPDKAFHALSGDDKEVVKRLKKANRDALKAIERAKAPGGQFSLGLEAEQDADAFEHLPDDTLEAIETKRAAFAALQEKLAASRARLAADLFVAAFVLPKTAETEARVPTSQDLWLVQNGSAPRPGVADVARRAAEAAQAFHWWQAFPQVRAKGGFDVLLGNPPWERIKLQEEEFFATRSPLVAEAQHKAERGRRIGLLAEGMLLHTLYPEVEAAQGLAPPNGAEQALYADFLAARRNAEAASLFAHDAGRYPLTGVGDVNTYALFAETFAQLMAEAGRAGFIVPTGIATDDSTKAFFAGLTQAGRLASLYDIENREAVFPSVHRSYKFCLLTLGRTEAAEFVCFATQTHQLADPRRRFTLTPDEFRLINPNTLTCPVFRSERDAALTKKLYRAAPVLVQDGPPEVNPWGVQIRRVLDMAKAEVVGACLREPQTGFIPVYEAKMIHQFDHRWASYGADGSSGDVAVDRKKDPDFRVTPRYWVEAAEVEARLADKGWARGWLMGWRDITNATNERTVIASVMPRVGTDFTLRVNIGVTKTHIAKYACLLANLNAITLDFCARQKIGGTHLADFITKQLPVLPPDRYTEADLAFIVPRVLELTYTACDLKPWAADLGHDGPPFPWNPERRAQLRAELDAYYAHLYGLTRDELRYILDPADVMGEDYPSETFRVLKNNEMREFGEYRTRRLVLEAWDKLHDKGKS